MPSRSLPSIESKIHSVLVSWDFGAAFPSVAWQFLFVVVRHMSLLHGFHEVVCGMYHMTVSLLIQVSSLELYSIISSRGYKSGRCWTLSGVLLSSWSLACMRVFTDILLE